MNRYKILPYHKLKQQQLGEHNINSFTTYDHINIMYILTFSVLNFMLY